MTARNQLHGGHALLALGIFLMLLGIFLMLLAPFLPRNPQQAPVDCGQVGRANNLPSKSVDGRCFLLLSSGLWVPVQGLEP